MLTLKQILTLQKRYLKYHFRWQVSGFVMMVPMYLVQKLFPTLELGINIQIAQFIGAIIFWYIDKHLIFEPSK